MWTIYSLSEILILSIILAVSHGETQVAVSDENTCVLNGTDVYCWGEGTYGILGIGDTSHLYEPPATAIDLGSAFAVEQLECGHQHYCGVSSNKTLKCWGRNNNGQLGQGDTNNRGDEPGEMGNNLLVIELGSDFEVDHVSGGAYHTCVTSTNYEIKCFGRNDYGQLGYGNTDNIGNGEGEMGDSLSVINLGTAFVPIRVECGGYHSCALSQNSTIKCWGRNNNGQLGQGDTNDRGDNSDEMGDNLTPIDLGTGFTVSKIRCGFWQVCALSTDHDMKCWGQNNVYGRLGLGDTDNRGDNDGEMGDGLPVVDLGKEFVIELIGGGAAHTLALSNNGSLKAWGRNDHGQLGYGDVNERGDQEDEMGDYLDFIDLGTGFGINSIFSSSETQHSCALLENGTAFLGLKCWGLNDHGQLGLGDTDNRGDEANEMGDDLAFVSFVFAALPTQFPTTEPTVQPTIPTIEPTNEPTISPTADPTTYPTTYPTLEPTTKCEAYLNCTECTNLNTGHIPQCLWHFVDEHCYYLKELDSAEIYENENVVFENSRCVSTLSPSTVHPTEYWTPSPSLAVLNVTVEISPGSIANESGVSVETDAKVVNVTSAGYEFGGHSDFGLTDWGTRVDLEAAEFRFIEHFECSLNVELEGECHDASGSNNSHCQPLLGFGDDSKYFIASYLVGHSMNETKVYPDYGMSARLAEGDITSILTNYSGNAVGRDSQFYDAVTALGANGSDAFTALEGMNIRNTWPIRLKISQNETRVMVEAENGKGYWPTSFKLNSSLYFGILDRLDRDDLEWNIEGFTISLITITRTCSGLPDPVSVKQLRHFYLSM